MSKQAQNFLKSIQESLFHQQVTYLQSPQLLSHMANTKQQDYPSHFHKIKEINLEQILLNNHGPSIKKINGSREKYREIKAKIGNCMKALQQQGQLSIAEIVQWKQTILTTFLNRYLVQISKQCKQKSQILVYIWNTVFNIMDYLLKTISKMNQREEKGYLESMLKNHESYQTMIDNLRVKLNKKEDERKKQEEFIKILVYNLRYKRKEIKKLSKNLKLCTVKLNQFKDFYLDLQLEHIELLSENRDISKENALNLLKRKQQINHQKRKEFKLKQSRKRIRFQIQNQIQNQNQNQGDNVNKLNDQLQNAFNKYYSDEKNHKCINKTEKVAQSLFQNALDDFTVRIDQIPQTQTIIDFKNNTAFVDMATDMADFIRDVQQRQVQITFNDRLHEDMILHAAVQTMQIKPKVKVFEEIGIQIEQIELKILKLSKVSKVFDRSYILEDYRDRDRRFKMQTKTKTQLYLKSMREIHYYDDNKKTVELLDYELESNHSIVKGNAETQTDEAFVLNFAIIPSQLRNRVFEKEIYRYIEQAKRFQLQVLKNGEGQERGSTGKNWLKRNFRKNYLSDTIQNSRDLKDKSFGSMSYRNREGSASKLSSTRMLNRNKVSFEERNTSTMRSRPKLNENILEIKESAFEQFKSRTKDSQTFASSSNKFWVNKRNNEEMSKDKKQFLFDLNLSDKLLNKFNTNLEFTPQNKRLINDLEKISEQLATNKALFELLQGNINQNIYILKEELRKMLNKKRNNKKLPVSRQKSLTKIISLVYTYAYHFYLNHDKPLINLLIPLFHYFKIGYGQIKKNDLYLRMLYFLSQTICHKEECYIFESFILFLGLNMQENSKIKIGKESTCLYLKLLSNLSLNFKFPLNVEELYTTLELLDEKCRQILKQQKYEQQIIQKVIERVKLKLHSLINEGDSYSNIQNQCMQVKINVFKCCQFIIQELEKIKSIIYESYTHIYDYFNYVEGLTKEMFHLYIIKNMYLPKADRNNKLKWLEYHLNDKTASNETYLYKMVGLFLQLSIIDFNKMYFMALGKYRIKEEFLYLSINRRFNFFIKYVDMHPEEMRIENALIKHLLHREEKNVTKEVMNKKIMGLAYLQIIENEAQKVLGWVLGDNLALFHGI